MSNKAVIFENNTEMDPRAWSVMGLSAKSGDDRIGKFGSGLKMAISILLRTGHKVKIISSGQEYIFSLKKDQFRGQDFEQIYCNENPMPYTTNLGRNWKVWQAFRELYCNAKDEDGIVREYKGKAPFATAIIVEGEECYEVFKNKDKYFLGEDTELARAENVGIHSGKHKFFYRGNLAGDKFATIYNYNFYNGVELTEERTLVCDFSLKYEIAKAVTKLTNKNIIKNILTASSETVEGSLDWSYHYATATDEFKEVAQTLYEGKIGEISNNLVSTIKKHAPQLAVKVLDMTPEQKEMVRKVKKKLFKMGYNVGHEIFMTEKQGKVLAFAFENKIYLTTPCFSSKTELAKAIFEEWAHNEFNFQDCSRPFQNYLIDQIFQQTKGKKEEKV